MAIEKTKKSIIDRENRKNSDGCAYRQSCYLASELNCFGYKIDCVLYRESNGEPMDQDRFDQAMNKLIDKTHYKYQSQKK